VGFRYTAQHLAQGFRVSGYVRNLPTGDVELVAEGEDEEVARFLDAIARKMQANIEHATVVEWMPSGYRGFGIRH
jgi:acylphosphatase